MAKIKLHVYLSQDDNILINTELFGVINDNVLEYNDGVINIFNLDNLLLERRNDDYILTLDFFNLVSIYDSDSYSMVMNLEIIDKVIDDGIFIKYKVLETGYVYDYRISWNIVT